ncbi:hypothetical protein HYFRA_00006246 [Hymenoscyphus fraxineus]|uniref:chitinase n=1 Tax=Hymenoscyphus fraxineus TaxID=746836 RepID=A0A9N9L7J9_9HELO|nr:hypothetical protein HYFRA_00006246 [Hymenoscyphus fraxineus]
MSKVSLAAAWLLLGARIVNAALNLDGTQAVQPLKIDDPSPIGDLTTYYPDQHDCPLPCVDYANIHSWISYLSVKRLQRCKEPMLLQLSVTQHLEDPSSHTLIRSCALEGQSSDSVTSPVNSSSNLQPVENPKKGSDLFQGSLDVAPACSFAGSPVEAELGVIASSGGGIGGNVEDILKGLQKFFDTPDNCDESFAFAYHGQTVASVYIGPGLGKSTVSSALEALSKSWEGIVLASNRTVAQLCGSGRDSTQILGVAFDTTGDLGASFPFNLFICTGRTKSSLEKMAAQWNNGNCVEQADLIPRLDLSIKAFDISRSAATNSSNDNSTSSSRTVIARKVNGQKRSELIKNSENLQKRATCSYIKVVSGDGCSSLVSRCKISAADFTKFNPKSNLCSTLQAGDYVCCSAGDPYTEPKPDPPKQGANGICATHLIQNGDSCDALAKQYGVTVAELEKWNKGKTWAWTECKNMLLGYNMCLSDGRAPLPPPQAGAECGPIVPGTLQPDSTTSIADLNPCPLKACCSNWGFCGVFPAHCDIHKPEGGGPGSKLDGFENTCVSNCGNDIKQNSGAPATFSRVGYYSSFNLERDCLWLSAKNANTDGSYTHIHWAFAEINSSSWKPVIKESKDGQWKEFKELKNVKRIVSFGGWAASTEAATYNIIRSAIITNRNLFASNLATFANEEGIDGIDIDWEYPGAPDILVGGSPIGQKTDGLDYLKFLTVLKQQLGTDRSVSIAAPASYWYLKAFPIDRIAAVIDYIVYMTYDLHGQWDAGNPNAYDQCDSGRCIRSHVNLTETRNSLAIITKAGVPNNKVFVGEASYGRSFHMASDGCWGPMCDFTGSRTQSDANAGRCTKTGGYLSNAELIEIIQRGGATQTFHDGASNSDILLYQGDYVSYMTPTTKETRRSDWKSLNFAGSIDWALDLQAFTTDDMETPPGYHLRERWVAWQERMIVSTQATCVNSHVV